MDGDDFDDEFDIDFVNSASNKVKAKWAKTSIDKDLKDVTNTLDEDSKGSKNKKKSKSSNFIDIASSDKQVFKTNSIDILNSEASDEDEEVPPRSKEASLNITITPPGSPSNSPRARRNQPEALREPRKPNKLLRRSRSPRLGMTF